MLILPEGAPQINPLECTPSIDALEDYQDAIVALTKFDDDGLMRGWRPTPYFLRGIHEELLELFEVPMPPLENQSQSEDTSGNDSVNEYSRFQVMTLLQDPASQDKEQRDLHLKEFGDVSWYLIQALKNYQIPLDAVLASGILYTEYIEISAQGTDEDHRANRRRMPWLQLINDVDAVKTAVTHLLNPYYIPTKDRLATELRILHNESTEDELRLWYSPDNFSDAGVARDMFLRASGRYIISAAHVLQAQFDTSFEQILADNIEKLKGREERGTTLKHTDGSGGGDTR